MSGTAGAIKGGMAYVQAYLDDNPLTKGLAKLQGKLKVWQASLSTLAAGTMGGGLPEPFAAIARFAASPAGAFAALTGAAKYTADARANAPPLRGYGRGRGKTLAIRLRGPSRRSLQRGPGRRPAEDAVAGVSVGPGRRPHGGAFGALGNGDAADKLREFIRLAENMPSEERIGLARKMGLSELLPLINQGVDALDAFTARARQLGLVVSQEDAEAGKRFQQVWGDLHDVLMSSVQAIGGAWSPSSAGSRISLSRLSPPCGIGSKSTSI